MTRREFLEKVINESANEEIKNFAKDEIAKMDARNAKRASTPSKRAVENEPIKAEIVKILTDEPKTASEIAESIGVSVQKASALLRQIEGLAVSEVKVKGKGKVKGYAIA